MSSTPFETTVSWTLSPFSCAGCKRIDRVNIHGLRVSSRSCVAWHGTTNPQTKFRIHIRHDFQTRVLELSIQCFSTCSNTNTSKPASLISSSNVSFNLFLIARHVGVPPFNPCLEFQHRAQSWRNNCAKQIPLSSRCRWIVSFLQSPQAAHAFFCKLATLPFAPELVEVTSVVCICCSTKSRLCTPRSTFVEGNKDSRSMSSRVISAAQFSVLSFFRHCRPSFCS